MKVELLFVEGCPQLPAALKRLDSVLEHMAAGTAVEQLCVKSDEQAHELEFMGSPSIRIDGVDIEGRATGAPTMACRSYAAGGAPPQWMIEAAVLRALRPRGLLFLCVANSARSQMAEGIARSMAPAATKVWSAGSKPTQVRAEAIAVLREINTDISAHHSKAVASVPADEVDTVITLCAEEECPLFLGEALRLHWGLPDPAAAAGAEGERLAAFRATRDELRRRFEILFTAVGDG